MGGVIVLQLLLRRPAMFAVVGMLLRSPHSDFCGHPCATFTPKQLLDWCKVYVVLRHLLLPQHCFYNRSASSPHTCVRSSFWRLFDLFLVQSHGCRGVAKS